MRALQWCRVMLLSVVCLSGATACTANASESLTALAFQTAPSAVATAKWGTSPALADAPKPAKKCDCDCCKPTCKCEPGKRDPQCKCYPCPATQGKGLNDGVKPQAAGKQAAALDFKDIGFFNTSSGPQLAFIRLTSGKEISADSLKGKDYVVYSNGHPKTASDAELQDWSSRHVGTRVFVGENIVFFFADKEVEKSKPQAFPAAPSCPGGNCPFNAPSCPNCPRG